MIYYTSDLHFGHLPTMDVEYWTELDNEAVTSILEKKHKYDI